MVHELARVGADHVELPLASKNPVVMTRNIGRLRALIGERGVDIVHARSRAPAWSAFFASRKEGVPFVTTFHAPYNRGAPFKTLYNSVMTRGDRVIAISNFIADHIEQVYKIDRRRIRVVHRGIDVDLFDPRRIPAARVIKLAGEGRLPEDVRVVLLPARVTRWKGQAVLIEALSRIDTTGLRCLIVGDEQGRAGYRRELDRLVDRLGLGAVVQFVGKRLYGLAGVLSPGDGHQIGAQLFDLVGADQIRHGQKTLTGWLFEPDSIDALAGTLDGVLRLGPSAREHIAERAMANVRANFTKEQMCARTLEIYSEVLTEASARAYGRS